MDFDSSLQRVSGLLYFGFLTFCSPARARRLLCTMHRDMQVWNHFLIFAFRFCNVNTSSSTSKTQKRTTVLSGETSMVARPQGNVFLLSESIFERDQFSKLQSAMPTVSTRLPSYCKKSFDNSSTRCNFIHWLIHLEPRLTSLRTGCIMVFSFLISL